MSVTIFNNAPLVDEGNQRGVPRDHTNVVKKVTKGKTEVVRITMPGISRNNGAETKHTRKLDSEVAAWVTVMAGPPFSRATPTTSPTSSVRVRSLLPKRAQQHRDLVEPSV